MYCTNCGTEITEGAKFCTECGSPVERALDSNAAGAEDVAIAEIMSVESTDIESVAPAATAAPAAPAKELKERKLTADKVLLVFAAILLMVALLSWLVFLALDISEEVAEIGSMLSGMMSVLGMAVFMLAGLIPAFCALIAFMQTIKPFISRDHDIPSSRGTFAWVLLILSAVVLCDCIAFKGASFSGLLLLGRIVSETYLYASIIGIVCSALAIFCLIGARFRRLDRLAANSQSDEEAGDEE